VMASRSPAGEHKAVTKCAPRLPSRDRRRPGDGPVLCPRGDRDPGTNLESTLVMAEEHRHDPPGRPRAGRGWDSWGVGPVHGATSDGRGWWQGEPLTAADVMTGPVTTVPRQLGVPQIAELMRRESVGVVPVVGSDDCLVGIVTDRDIVVRGCVSSRPLSEQTAADVMTEDVECARSDETLAHVLERMARRRVRRLPVLAAEHRREPKVVGMISLDEITAHAPDDPTLATALERVSQRRREQERSTGARPVSFLPALWRRLVGHHHG
jgi:CBS domain-containing protein